MNLRGLHGTAGVRDCQPIVRSDLAVSHLYPYNGPHMTSGRILAAVAAFALFAAVRTPAATALLPIEEVRPGMTGIGRTVFEGDRLDEFKVHIIGVLRNVIGTRR